MLHHTLHAFGLSLRLLLRLHIGPHLVELRRAVLVDLFRLSLLHLTILRPGIPHQPRNPAAPQAVDRLAALGVGRVAEDTRKQALPFRGLDER